ncbi:MAG: hypothetical protein Q8942_14605, partial [Bacillota bacterium]|nr:hypothetical protein [Bacillota bacterium]
MIEKLLPILSEDFIGSYFFNIPKYIVRRKLCQNYQVRWIAIFDRLVGQMQIKEILANSLKNDKVAHAYVFTGPKGIGKKTFAKSFSGLLLCSERQGELSCGECLACKTFDNDTNPDIHIIDGSDGSIGVDEIRTLQSDIILKPMYS